MDLALTQAQETLKAEAREFFERECPTSLVREMEGDERGYSADMWERMAALGWMGLPFPERYGGSGGALTDLAVLLEEFGRALAPGPFFNSVAVVGLTILDAGSESQKSDILPRIADGSLISTAALLEEDARYSPEAIRMQLESGDGEFFVNGTKMFVEYANSADSILTPVRTSQNGDPESGVKLALIPDSAPGIRATSLESIARDRQFALHFEDVPVPSDSILAGEDGGWPALKRTLDRASLLHCAQSLGGAQQVLEMTVDYTKQRVQFDRPIASFQSVQHSCADMVIAIDSARLAVYQAITRIEDGEDADREIALAKTLTNHAYKWTTLTAQQVHGGIAFMEEYDLQLWTRRAKVAELKFGASSGYVETFARRMGLA
ncbi:MAG: acyl-CoA/acyl-ACP dehydrogenase [Dehalococcoidia bacterium]|nr:acyl-CoA/acyl-ACP dehydrogenase [Dehalococcoidia bacterium]